MPRRRNPTTAERRGVLRGLATGLAGAVAAPVATEASPAPHTQDRARVTATSGLLDPEERATLESLCGLLVPGSIEARVPELLDRVATVESPDDQRALRNGIRAFEGEARRRHQSRWVDLDAPTQRAILNEASDSESLYEAFRHLRNLVARTYFATEPGMRKLGWTPRNAWRELPGCIHPDDDHR